MSMLREEVRFLRAQVDALMGRERERDMVDALIAGGTAVTYGMTRPALRVVSGTATA